MSEAEIQLDMFGAPLEVPPKKARRGWLAEPLTRAEQREIGRKSVENQGLVRLLGSKMCKKYPMVDNLDVFSCIDIAFLKACRAHDSARGKFSTTLTVYAEGEIRHFIRDHNFMISAPSQLRELSTAVRKLAAQGHSLPAIAETLGTTTERVRESIIATTGVAHEQKHWEHHLCSRPTPFDVLIMEDELPAS